MQTSDNVFVGNEARAKLIIGVDKVVDAVKTTLGAKGTNAIIEAFEPPHAITTNDGISIIESIKLADPIEQMGANLVKETSGRHNKQAGDGSTTTAVLLQAILREGIKSEANPLELKRSLEECLPIIEASIETQKEEITPNDVGAVASISAEDEKIGALIQEVYEKIGKDGILYQDISKTFEDYYTIGKGVKIDDAGFASPYMADTDESGNFLKIAKFKNPSVLLVRQKLTSALELNDVITKLYNTEKKELVIFADEIEAPVIPQLVMTRAKSGFKTILIKMPVLWKDWWYADIAQMTGATVIDEAGVSLKNATLEHLGTCGEILVDKDSTFLDGVQDISAHLQVLKEEDTDEAKIRIARLNTKTARLFVGAHSDQALSYKRLKVEDARNAAYLALQGGVVAGGGIALLNASRELPDTIGGKILSTALWIPLAQIIQNAGSDYSATDTLFGGEIGFDAKSNTHVNMWDAKILDPVLVVKNSIRNAISVAGTVLTARVVVTLNKVEQTTPNVPTI